MKQMNSLVQGINSVLPVYRVDITAHAELVEGLLCMCLGMAINIATTVHSSTL